MSDSDNKGLVTTPEDKLSKKKQPVFALAGNPNCGKTSLFNSITGSHQHVGNWGGVTVEIKEGRTECDGEKIKVIDLPGIYSLSAESMDERVARDFLLEEKPDVVINVIDSTNLERNLYLTVQMLEIGIRPVLAFNMWDEVKAKGIEIDIKLLSELLDLPIVTTIGKSGTNVKELIAAASDSYHKRETSYTKKLSHFPAEIVTRVDELSKEPLFDTLKVPKGWAALKLLENDPQIQKLVHNLQGGKALIKKSEKFISEIEALFGEDTVSLIAEARYGFTAGAIRETIKKTTLNRVEISDHIDKVLTHPVWAYPVFLLFMLGLFQLTFFLGEYPAAFIEGMFESLGHLVGNYMSEGVLRELISDGILQGVGGVAVFLPHIMILFFGIAIMEDSGYMARAAFIMDKVMHKVGLHGKSFIPMLMGMGCNVPAIMATRTLESRTDRTKTILLAPLISCSARLPIYVLFAGALFTRNAGTIVFLFHFVFGTAAFFALAWVFKKTLFRGEDVPFVMELPPYRIPTLKSVMIHMWQRAEHYIKKMGGVILVFSIIIWALGKYPVNNQVNDLYDEKISSAAVSSLPEEHREAAIAELEARRSQELIEYTYIGRLGKTLEPAVRPLGFKWEGAVALATGFVAKEIVVSTLGVLYATGDDSAEDDVGLQSEIAANFSPLAAFSFMIFVLLYTPCIVALVTVIRELKSIKWSLFSIFYQVGLAWVVSFAVFQLGKLLGLG